MHPHHRGKYDPWNFQREERCESFMGFPLLTKQAGAQDELVGVLKVETKMRIVSGVEEFTYFNELDEIVGGLIANSAAIAIQNTRLLEERREAERLQAWRQFSANTAHRMGTEAARIEGALTRLGDALKTGTSPRDVEEFINRIHDANETIKGHVFKFAEFVKPPQLRFVETDLTALLRQAASLAPPDNIRIGLELPDSMPVIQADQDQLLYAFKELVQNAIAMMSPRGGALKIVCSPAGSDRVQVNFEDSGPGVPDGNKERIFEPGFTKRRGGIGLGLTLVKTAIEGHHGAVRERGRAGQGANFEVLLPARQPREESDR